MKRLRRILFNGLAALSLLLALATAGLWVRSQFTHEQWTFSTRRNFGAAFSAGGVVRVEVLDQPYQRQFLGKPDESFRIQHDAFDPSINVMPFKQPAYGFGSRQVLDFQNKPHLLNCLTMPHWWAAILFALLPGIRAVLHWSRRNPPGHCPACGYDVRANPAKCSECGQDIPATA